MLELFDDPFVDVKQDKMQEECGVFGYFSKENHTNLAYLTYYGLFALQHRGQESVGMSISLDNQIHTYKRMGLVSQVFTPEILNLLTGNIAIGHVRYSTSGVNSNENCQPLQSQFGSQSIAMAHNGNLTNADILRRRLTKKNISFQTTIDSEVIIKLISLHNHLPLPQAIKTSLSHIKGAYGLVFVCDNKLIGVRDPYGIRPLCLGKTAEGDYVLASESCALDAVGAELVRDIENGEMIIIDKNGITSQKIVDYPKPFSPCTFEYIYFARPDTIMDGIDVYLARVEAGRQLARQNKVKADIVIGVPDSGVPAAIGFSEVSGIPYAHGLIKSKYVARTFIQPSQDLREKAVLAKLNPIRSSIEGKNVVVIDDSLVRGTTSKILIQILRRAKAKSVHFRSASPPVKYPCFYGIDTANRGELLAAKMNIAEMCEFIGADSLDFLQLNEMMLGLGCKGGCTACFNGRYPEPKDQKKDID
ncbi:MAG: amidophosphoribosyltransferase [Pasteurella sp.]|nr:amidophosphoribosyltransferase [Pasteurella sp.]